MYRERLEILKNWRQHVEDIAKAARSLLRSCEVYVFGSAISERLTAASDVDVLIVAENLPEGVMKRAELKIEIERMANLPVYHPIQIHLIKKDELKRSSIYLEIVRNKDKIWGS